MNNEFDNSRIDVLNKSILYVEFSTNISWFAEEYIIYVLEADIG